MGERRAGTVNESEKVDPKSRKYPMFVDPCEHVPKTHPAAKGLCYLCSHSTMQYYIRLCVCLGVHKRLCTIKNINLAAGCS